MEDLLPELMVDILSRLPVKSIIHCNRVCKKWRNLVLDSMFVNLHLSRSPTGFIVHQLAVKFLSNGTYTHPGILKWVEIEDKVDDHHLHHGPPMRLDLNMVPIFQNSVIAQKGSVNGLICLWRYSRDVKFDYAYICNPVTREILTLPSPRCYKQKLRRIGYGFGVSSLTGEYKVVRTLQGNIPLDGYELEAEVYTLGTGQWRNLGRVPYRFDGYYGPFLNDHFHWILSIEEDAPEKICTFDLNKETYQLFPSPPSEAIDRSCNHLQSLAVLKGCLCKSDAIDFKLTFWVMKEYGIKKSWHKEVVMKQGLSRDLQLPNSDSISLIECLKDGTILFVTRVVFVYFLTVPLRGNL